MEPLETLASRSTKLTQLVLEKGNKDLKYQHLVSREALLDALFALYDECNHEFMKRNKHIAKFVDKYQEAVADLRGLQVNISDFEVKKIIGRGHFGEVHMVREKLSGNTFAMKILKKSLTLDQEAVAFYEEERDIMMKSSSPWVTQLQYSFQDFRNLYLVMEFLPGGDMLSLLERHNNTLPEDVAQFYIAELVLAVHSVHSMNYVHRDIKPDNILIDRTGHIKLADFGSASRLNEAKLVTSKMPVGTPDYIAPEVLTAMNSNRPSSYGLGCDWWSVGVVTYEMLYGMTPFGDDKVLITYSNIMNHKKTLTFAQDEVKISDGVKDMLSGLLQEEKKRYGYKELYNHIFFKDVDWLNILKSTPPYVPSVSGADDTSYFDDFDPENARPSLEPFKPKKEFTGKNLPFVGFTYSSCLALQPSGFTRSSSVAFDCFLDPNKTLKSSKSAMEQELKKEMFALEAVQNTLKTEVGTLQGKLNCTEAEKEELLTRNKELQETLTERDQELASMRTLLDLETQNRKNTENRAVELVKAIDQKYKKREALLSEGYGLNVVLTPVKKKLDSTSQVDSPLNCTSSTQEDLDHEIELLKAQLAQTTQELQQVKSQLNQQAENQQKLSTVEDLRNGIGDHEGSSGAPESIHQEILRLKMAHNKECEKLWAKLEESEAFCEELKSDLRVMKIDLKEASTTKKFLEKEKREFQSNIDTLKQIINQLEDSLRKAENKLKRTSQDGDSKLVKESIRHMEIDIEETSNDCKDLKQKLVSLQSQLDSAQSDLQQNREKYKTLKKDAVRTVQSLEVDLNKSKLAKATLENKMTELEVKHQSSLKELENTLREEFEKAYKVLRDELKITSDLKEELSSQHKILEAELKGASGRAPLVATAEVEVNTSMTGETTHSVISKVSSMESVLKRIHATQVTETNYIKELKEILRKKEKDIADLKLDLRILEREKKEFEGTVSGLRDMNRNNRERFINLDKEHSKCSEGTKDLMEKVQNLQEENQIKHEEREKMISHFETEKQVLLDRIQGLKDEQNAKRQLEQKCARNEGQYQELDRQNLTLKDRLENLQDEKQKLFVENDSLKLDLKGKVQHCLTLEKNVAALKSASSALEEMIKDLELIIEKGEENEIVLQKDMCSLRAKLDVCEHERISLEQKLNSETRLRLELDAQGVDAEADFLTRIDHLHSKNSSLQNAIDRQNEWNSQLSTRCSHIEGQLEQRISTNEYLKGKIKSAEMEIQELKEEAAALKTATIMLQKKNYDLQDCVENSQAIIEQNRDVIESLENEIESDKASYKQEVMKLDAQLQQHSKLVELLQNRLKEGDKKKRWPFGLLGKSKENKDAILVSTGEKKRDRIFRMNVEMKEAHGKMFSKPGDSPRSLRSDSVSVSGSTSSDDYSESASQSSGTMRHNIPHLFNETRSSFNTLCSACGESIRWSKPCLKCRACHLVLHHHCKELALTNCGIPRLFAESIRQKQPNVKAKVEVLKGCNLDDMRGWVKLPRSRNAGWEERFLCMDGTSLAVLNKELCLDENGDSRPLEGVSFKVELCPEDGVVTMKVNLSSQDRTCLQGCTDNLSLMLQLSTWTFEQSQPTNNFLFLLTNEHEKSFWIEAINRKIIGHLEKQHMLLDHKQLEKSLILSVELPPVKPTCCYQLTREILLVGTTNGIFVLVTDQLPLKSFENRIPTVAGLVSNLICLDSLGVILFVSGDEGRLLSILYSDILNWLKHPKEGGKIAVNSVANIVGCKKIAAAEKLGSSPAALALATEKEFVLLKWNSAICSFVPKKNVKLTIPCSCIHLTAQVALFAMDKLYVVDLKDPSDVEEFLDSSTSNSLDNFISNILKEQQSNVHIATVSPPGQQEEYLLCLRDFGVVINCLGQQDSTNIKQISWTRQPTHFYYNKPYLFVLSEDSDRSIVEVIHITPDGETLRGSWVYLNLPQPKFLGQTNVDGVVYISSTSSFSTEILRVDGSTVMKATNKSHQTKPGELLSSRASSGSSEFSFTSSLEEALDTSDMLSAVLEINESRLSTD